MRVFSTAFVLAVSLGCNDAAVDTAPPPLREEVTAGQTVFSPNNVRIRAGGTVQFNFTPTAHSVIFTQLAGSPENIQSLTANTIEERTFEVAGTFPYQCGDQSHAAMTGTITVEPAPANPSE